MYITYYVLLLDVFVVVTDGTSGVSAVWTFSIYLAYCFSFFLVFVIICLFATSSGELKIFISGLIGLIHAVLSMFKWLAFYVAGPSVWNSSRLRAISTLAVTALNVYLSCTCLQRIEAFSAQEIYDDLRYINWCFNYLLTYFTEPDRHDINTPQYPSLCSWRR